MQIFPINECCVLRGWLYRFKKQIKIIEVGYVPKHGTQPDQAFTIIECVKMYHEKLLKIK